MSFRIQAAAVEEAEQVFAAMRLAFKEYRGKLYPESGALRETLEDVRSGIASGLIGTRVAEARGQPVVVENRTGARVE